MTTAADILSALACGSAGCSCSAAARRGSGLTHCPSHSDSRPSLNVTERDSHVLIHCHADCAQDAVLGALRERGLWNGAEPTVSRAVVAQYDYLDEHGQLLYHVERVQPKTFRVRRPDGRGGWTYGLGDTRRVLYRLPEVVSVARQGWRVFLVEGEKDADRIAEDVPAGLGLCATSGPFGATKWRGEYAEALRGAEVVVIADKDEPGRAHAQQVAASCLGKARSVRVLELPGEHVKDAADWISAGGTREQLEALADAAAEWLRTPKVATRADGALSAGPVVVPLDAVEPEEVEWLWPGRIPRGKLTLIVGDPGLGKSFLTLDMAARLSRGLAWPDGATAPLGDTLILSAEDGLADTIAPRLIVAGADRSRVHALTMIRDERGERGFDLSRDVEQLGRALADLRGAGRLPLVVFIDPVTAYLGRDVDSHVAAEVRGALAPLAGLAERERVAIVCIAHLNKAASRALYRVSGSLAFVAAARSVLAVAPASPDPHELRRVLGSLKSNLGPPPATLAFTIDAGRVAFEPEPVEVDVAAALRGPDESGGHAPRDEAAAFLRDLLAEGPVAASEVLRLAGEAGISRRTLERARDGVGVVSDREGGLGASGRWVWTLRTPNAPKNATPHGGGLRPKVAVLDDIPSRAGHVVLGLTPTEPPL